MSDEVKPWLDSWVLEQLEVHGRSFTAAPRVKFKKVQIIKFHTFLKEAEETVSHKDRCVWATVSDRKHTILARFNDSALTEYTNNSGHIGSRRLTQTKGSVAAIKTFKLGRSSELDGERLEFYLDANGLVVLGACGQGTFPDKQTGTHPRDLFTTSKLIRDHVKELGNPKGQPIPPQPPVVAFMVKEQPVAGSSKLPPATATPRKSNAKLSRLPVGLSPARQFSQARPPPQKLEHSPLHRLRKTRQNIEFEVPPKWNIASSSDSEPRDTEAALSVIRKEIPPTLESTRKPKARPRSALDLGTSPARAPVPAPALVERSWMDSSPVRLGTLIRGKQPSLASTSDTEEDSDEVERHLRTRSLSRTESRLSSVMEEREQQEPVVAAETPPPPPKISVEAPTADPTSPLPSSSLPNSDKSTVSQPKQPQSSQGPPLAQRRPPVITPSLEPYLTQNLGKSSPIPSSQQYAEPLHRMVPKPVLHDFPKTGAVLAKDSQSQEEKLRIKQESQESQERQAALSLNQMMTSQSLSNSDRTKLTGLPSPQTSSMAWNDTNVVDNGEMDEGEKDVYRGHGSKGSKHVRSRSPAAPSPDSETEEESFENAPVLADVTTVQDSQQNHQYQDLSPKVRRSHAPSSRRETSAERDIVPDSQEAFSDDDRQIAEDIDKFNARAWEAPSFMQKARGKARTVEPEKEEEEEMGGDGDETEEAVHVKISPKEAKELPVQIEAKTPPVKAKLVPSKQKTIRLKEEPVSARSFLSSKPPAAGPSRPRASEVEVGRPAKRRLLSPEASGTVKKQNTRESALVQQRASSPPIPASPSPARVVVPLPRIRAPRMVASQEVLEEEEEEEEASSAPFRARPTRSESRASANPSPRPVRKAFVPVPQAGSGGVKGRVSMIFPQRKRPRTEDEVQEDREPPRSKKPKVHKAVAAPIPPIPQQQMPSTCPPTLAHQRASSPLPLPPVRTKSLSCAAVTASSSLKRVRIEAPALAPAPSTNRMSGSVEASSIPSETDAPKRKEKKEKGVTVRRKIRLDVIRVNQEGGPPWIDMQALQAITQRTAALRRKELEG